MKPDWYLGLIVILVGTFAIGFVCFDQGVKWQQAQECLALGGEKVDNVCVKGTEIVRRW